MKTYTLASFVCSAILLASCTSPDEPVGDSAFVTSKDVAERIATSTSYYHPPGFTGPPSMNGISKRDGHSESAGAVNVQCWVSPSTCFTINGSFLHINEVENPTGWFDTYSIYKNGP